MRTSAVRAASSLFGALGLPMVQSEPSPKRGRGATPRVELVLPAATTGRTVRFRFRPLGRHCRPLAGDGRRAWRVACELLGEYAAAVGGFRLARDRVVRTWADLLADFTPQELRWAIAAKAASLAADTPAERRRLRRYVSRPERFPAVVPAWLMLSPAYQRRQCAAEDAGADRLRRRLSEIRPQALCVGGPSEGLLADGKRARQQGAAVDRSAHWRDLTDSRRAAAMVATVRLFRDRCAAWGFDPEAPEAAPIRLGFAADWARRQWPVPRATPGLRGDFAGAVNDVQTLFVEASRTS